MKSAKDPETVWFSLVSYPNSWVAYINTTSGKGEFKPRNSAPKNLNVSLKRAGELKILTEKLFRNGESFEIGRSAPDSMYRIITWHGLSAKVNSLIGGELSSKERTYAELFDDVWRNLSNETSTQQ